MRARLFAVCLALLAFAAPASAFIEDDTYRHGAGYASFPVGSAEECRQACADDDACMAWTTFRAGLRGPAPLCELKSAIPQGQPNPCCQSGLAPRLEPVSPATSARDPRARRGDEPRLFGGE